MVTETVVVVVDLHQRHQGLSICQSPWGKKKKSLAIDWHGQRRNAWPLPTVVSSSAVVCQKNLYHVLQTRYSTSHVSQPRSSSSSSSSSSSIQPEHTPLPSRQSPQLTANLCLHGHGSQLTAVDPLPV
ncbi:hypothetical protein ACJQWK_03599 [Exserohilum turcicum]